MADILTVLWVWWKTTTPSGMPIHLIKPILSIISKVFQILYQKIPSKSKLHLWTKLSEMILNSVVKLVYPTIIILRRTSRTRWHSSTGSSPLTKFHPSTKFQNHRSLDKSKCLVVLMNSSLRSKSRILRLSKTISSTKTVKTQ